MKHDPAIPQPTDETGTLGWVMKAVDWELQKKGCIPMSEHTVGASLVRAPKIGGDVRHREKGELLPVIALPVFGYKSHVGIDRRYGFIREMAVAWASAADGRLLPRVVSTDNTRSQVWADSAYRSMRNEKWLSDRILTSPIRRRKRRIWRISLVRIICDGLPAPLKISHPDVESGLEEGAEV